LVGTLLLEAKSPFGSCRKLTLGQTIDAIVLHDVNHVDIPAHDVLKLTHTDAGRVTIAGDANPF
jgi:hypothetical protein